MKIYQLTRKEREMMEGFLIQIILKRQVVLISELSNVAMLHTTRNVVAIARLKHLMTESFTISKLPTSDSVSSVASWVMALQCTVTSLDSFLVIFA